MGKMKNGKSKQRTSHQLNYTKPYMQELCAEKGIELIDKGNGHLQLKGDLLVNYYPLSKDKSAYVAGTKKAVKGVIPSDAVNMCMQAPNMAKNVNRDKRSGSSRKMRWRMLKKGINKCRWCTKPLNLDNSTVEHIVPLARGGLDNPNNRTLACKQCNDLRGCDMPELNTSKGK